MPLLALVLCACGPVSALGVPSSLLSGAATLEPLTLEENSATLASSPDGEVASEDNIAIRAINPGYTTDAGKNSGELIELVNLSENTLILDGLKILYQSKTASSPVLIYEFPDGARFVGRSILLRYSGSPEASAGNQDLTYDTSLAMAGSLALIKSDKDIWSELSLPDLDAVSATPTGAEALNAVCWLGGDDCLPIFSTTVKSRSYTTILRDDETGEYSHVNDPELLYNPDSPGLYLPEISNETPDASIISDSDASAKTASADFDPSATPVCPGLEFSEILTYYVDDVSEQFIELYNNSAKSVDLSKCRLRHKKKLYYFASAQTVLAPGAYYVYHPEISLTKNPTTELLFEIMDVNGDVADSLNLPHGQKKKTSYALTGHDPSGGEIWQLTYNPTPGSANSYQEFQTCPAGKVINVLTGNCVNASTMKSSLNDCGVGKYRNPETGRCKSYSSDSSEQAPCQEGYERNPETNRCRKIKNNSGADYPVVQVTDTEEYSSFIALWAIGAIAALGLGYVVFQFRHEIAYFSRQLLTKLKK